MSKAQTSNGAVGIPVLQGREDVKLFHGWAKLQNGTAGIEGMLAKVGLSAFFAYGVYLGELVAPLMLFAGFFVVPATLVVAVNLVAAVLLAFFFVVALVVALTTPRKKNSS